MATPMRSSSQEAGHRARVADSGTSQGNQAAAKPLTSSSSTLSSSAVAPAADHLTAAATAGTNTSSSSSPSTAATAANPPATSSSSNFEYDDNEWDIGIGDLIIDLDADIEKTTEKSSDPTPMAANAAGPQATKAASAKMAVEHSATVDKGLKMKIKRTKPGTKTSEAKHEIVKSNEQQQNGSADPAEMKNQASTPTAVKLANASAANAQGAATPNNKRGSSGHRRDKTRDKHAQPNSSAVASEKGAPSAGGPVANSNASAPSGKQTVQQPGGANGAAGVTVAPAGEMNGMVRVATPQTAGAARSVFAATAGPGPPPATTGAQTPGTGASAGVAQAVVKNEPVKGAVSVGSGVVGDDRTSPPPSKKIKTEPKEVTDVCVGTSVGTITEPDCLGPCEPGTSVTLEGIVWHETEGGVLVVNVTWRGKTYVGTLLDCTRHDWAPPRFCDSPTSDLDNRTPKGRETRSSVHSKLRNGGLKGRRGAANNGSGPSTAPSSPTPFIPPRSEPSNKRKQRAEEESPQQQQQQSPAASGKKTKVIIPPPIPPPTITTASQSTCLSPPPSPILLECPEPNCSKKYKHINGLKYHQSHAHGAVDDEDTKDVTSMSENDESNIEAPSPVTPVKSPEKSQDSPIAIQKRDDEIAYIFKTGGIMDVPSQPTTPRSTPPSPITPQCLQEIVPASSPSVAAPAESKSVVKPGVLRFNTPDEFPVGVFSSGKSQPLNTPTATLPAVRNLQPLVEQALPQNEPNTLQTTSFTNQLQAQANLPTQQFTQPPSLIIPTTSNAPQLNSQMSPHPSQPPSPACKVANFKVKPAAALMPDDKKNQQVLPNQTKPQNFKKKNRKSPAGSPHPPEQPIFGVETSGRDEVQSPAYSDISDDGAPVIESDVGDKNKNQSKKPDAAQPLSHLSQYGMYPFYGQPQYLVPNVQQTQDPTKTKEGEKPGEKSAQEKDTGKKDTSDYQQKVVPQHNYYPYGYMTGYPYNMEPNYGGVSMVQEDKIKEERVKESPSPIEQAVNKPIPNPIQVPTPGKVKQEVKDKHQNENHQIIKESIEIKNQMNPYLYSRQQQQIQQSPTSHHSQREEDVRRFYMYEQQRRKESQQQQHQNQQQSQQVAHQNQQSQQNQSSDGHKGTPNKAPPPQSPNVKQYKEPKIEDKKDKDIKQEGVKPTMETQGPPPPPTSQYAYIHHNYMQAPHYGALHFDPNHSMYRGLMVPGPYSANPYLLNTQIPRYHAPEDLSRAQPPTKALDMLEHHAQYYSSHKIHELQERAIKSPTPKTSVASSSPSTNSGPPGGGTNQPHVTAASPLSQSQNQPPSSGKQTPGAGKDSTRSPPPQRHVHTHHHTHVGLSYPMYPAPYGAAVIASQQAAAVTVINPYPTK